MAKRTVGKEKVSIPHSFFIPDGVEEFNYELEYGDEEVFDEFGETIEVIEPVYSISIVEQTIRRSDDGVNSVVDVIVEVEDTTGADNYELRVTKA
jgi:hypothetical protein